MKKRIINAPTPDILIILKRHMSEESCSRLDLIRVDAIGLLILSVPDLYLYTDTTSKSTNVVVSEVFGSCPQHITTLTISGKIAAMYEAMRITEGDGNQP